MKDFNVDAFMQEKVTVSRGELLVILSKLVAETADVGEDDDEKKLFAMAFSMFGARLVSELFDMDTKLEVEKNGRR